MFKMLIVGIIAGLISGFFGAGGGMIVVPAFIHIFKMEEKISRGTAVFAILPMVITSAFFYVKMSHVDWGLSIKCAVGGIIGGVVGAKLLKKLSNKILRTIFIISLIIVSIKMII